jgi:endosialidase-like protein
LQLKQVQQSILNKNLKTKTMTTLHLRKSIGGSPLRLAFLLIPLALACFVLSPSARAVSPAPDGGYPGANTAEGDFALSALTAGVSNTATGFKALISNTTGSYNTATGDRTLIFNSTGSYNTATGFQALEYAMTNTTTGGTANDNTATGAWALRLTTTGNDNTGTGVSALYSNTTGNNNTAHGWVALYYNTSGSNNTAQGFQALEHSTGSNNIALGSNAGVSLTTGSNNIDIGNAGVAGESATIRIGNGNQTKTFIAAIRGKTTVNANAVPVVIDSAGQLGTVSSSERFKKEIKSMDRVSEAILALKPVTFHYKSDKTDTPQFGLIAEEVAEVNPDLVVRDENGEIYTVRYDAVNAMLLNEFLKEHRKVEEQEATIAQVKSNAAKQEATIALQQQEIKALTASLKEQASQIQKVSAQLEMNKPAPQTVLNNQ